MIKINEKDVIIVIIVIVECLLLVRLKRNPFIKRSVAISFLFDFHGDNGH